MNFQQAIAARGIDEKHAILNLRNRLRYRPDPHGHYYFENTKWLGSEGRALLHDAAINNDTRVYCSVWSRVNHLKG